MPLVIDRVASQPLSGKACAAAPQPSCGQGAQRSVAAAAWQPEGPWLCARIAASSLSRGSTSTPSLFLALQAHNHGAVDDTLITPYHALLYSGVFVLGLFLAVTQYRKVGREGRRLDAGVGQHL